LNLVKSVDALKRNTHGAVFDTITTSTFDSILTILPNISILGEFENRLTPIFLTFENSTNENLCLKNLRDTLLPKLISGELEVSQIQNLP
jgi:type I restriction enzyme S subunit